MLVGSAKDVPRGLGREVRVEGIARDAKLGAAVVGEDGLVVFLLDRPSWPDELLGGRVAVRGRLERTTDFVARVGPDGAISQGTEGAILVLRTSELER